MKALLKKIEGMDLFNFQFLGYYTRVEWMPKGVNAILKLYKAGIVAYQHKSGGHYVAVQYKKDDKKYHIYNLFSDRTYSYNVTDIDYYFRELDDTFRFYWCVILTGRPIR